MKIAVVSIPQPEASGIATSYWNIARIFSLLGHKVFFLTGPGQNIRKSVLFSTDHQIQVIQVFPAVTFRSLFWSAGKRFLPYFFSEISPPDIDIVKFANSVGIKLVELMKDESIDLVLFADSFMEFIYFMPNPKIKVFIGIQCPRYLFQKISLSKEPINKYLYNLEQKLIPNANILTSPSCAMAELASKYYGIPKEKITVIPNLVDTELFYPETASIPEHKIGVCFVGRFSIEKGAQIIINIIPQLMEKYKNLHFSVVGESGNLPSGESLIEKLQLKMKEFGVSDRFTYQLKLSKTDLADFYRRNHIFFFPTLFESFGNVIAEAQACGLPVVANSVGGVPEIIKDGETGFLIKDNDENEYIAKLEQLIRHPDMRDKMGKMAVKNVQKKFSFQVVSEKLKEILK